MTLDDGTIANDDKRITNEDGTIAKQALSIRRDRGIVRMVKRDWDAFRFLSEGALGGNAP